MKNNMAHLYCMVNYIGNEVSENCRSPYEQIAVCSVSLFLFRVCNNKNANANN